MKHTLKVTITLVALFFLSQFMGMIITNEYIDHEKTAETGVTTWEELPYDFERPPVEENKSFILIITAVLIGTGLLLLLVRFKKVMWWKVWFFLSVLICLTIALNPFIGQQFAFLISFVLALIKVFRPNIFVHNITEIFVYGGLAAIFVPIMNMYSVFILLFLISVYDIYAVWKSKHMVKLAEFQTESKVFAGLSIPYNLPKKELKKDRKIKVEKIEKIKTAILGGGDVAFPLLFAGVAMKTFGFFVSLIIPLFATIALIFLFIKSKKDKFYPAMPFLTAGCLVGYGVIILFF
ncbi:MAG: presenilin family intramembrane aspartyl protease [Candidatus Nanoarchaeia archaeon]|nr:presenilin family intramembrane aspartyl protease [Candidatus Nanoarchaeia archaeon]